MPAAPAAARSGSSTSHEQVHAKVGQSRDGGGCRDREHPSPDDVARQPPTDRLEALYAPDADDGAGEPVTFLLGANAGETLRPLAKVASGGELARAMLALRLIAMGGPATMVFDEVDAGVGGGAALALGTALSQVAADRQVLVVTHLAQVAALADHQIGVAKTERGERTSTTARLLGPSERVIEIARMLSGHPDSEAAQAHARELLALGEHGGRSTTGRSPLV